MPTSCWCSLSFLVQIEHPCFKLLNLLLNCIASLLQQTQIIVQDLTKRNRQLENENATLQKRCDDLAHENGQLRNDKQALEQECYRLRVANAELTERNDNLARENKSLSG